VKCEQERHNEDKRNTIFMMSQKPRISASFLKRHLDIPFVSLIKILKKAPKVTFAIYSRIYSESKNNLFSSIVHNSKALVTACPPFWICLQIYFCSRRKRIFWDILCIHPEEGSKQWLRVARKRRVEAGKVHGEKIRVVTVSFPSRLIRTDPKSPPNPSRTCSS